MSDSFQNNESPSHDESSPEIFSSSSSGGSDSSKSSIIYNINPSAVPPSSSSFSTSSSSSSLSSSSQKEGGTSSSSSSSSRHDHSTSSSSHGSIKESRKRKKCGYHHPLIRHNVITYDDKDKDSDSPTSSSSSSQVKNIVDLPSELRNYQQSYKFNRITKNKDAQKINDILKEAHTSSNTLNYAECSMPPPSPSLIKYLSQIRSYQMIEKNGTNNDNKEDENRKEGNKHHEEYDTSALLSMGILSEEVITEMLLPLAHAHVINCRKMLSSKSKNVTQDDYMKKLIRDDPIEVMTELVLRQQEEQVLETDNGDNNENNARTKENKCILPLKHTQKWMKQEEHNNTNNNEYENFVNMLLTSSSKPQKND